jgi:hypothetical protein
MGTNMSPLITRSASLLQRKAANHFLMQAHYRACIAEAKRDESLGESMVRYYGERASIEQLDAAEAAEAARKLMGVDPAPVEHSSKTEAA